MMLPTLQNTYPIIDIIPPGDLAELGIATAVPVVQVPWFDERQTCALVLRYLAGESEGNPAEYRACPAYADYGCARCGRRVPKACVFEAPEYDPIWQRAMGWRLLEEADGSLSVCRAVDAAGIAADLSARVVGAVPYDLTGLA